MVSAVGRTGKRYAWSGDLCGPPAGWPGGRRGAV